MKILTAEQIREADRYTIEHEPVSSTDLMERASKECFKWFQLNVGKQHIVHIVCGTGNNGGDGLCLGRMLTEAGYPVLVFIISSDQAPSADFSINLQRLQSINPQIIKYISGAADFPSTGKEDIILDAIFGTGLSRNITGPTAEIIAKINLSGCQVVSIDMPSGIYSDKPSKVAGNEIIKATNTLTFQYPKTGLLIPENGEFVGNLNILDIGLSKEFDRSVETTNYFIDSSFARTLLKPRPLFSHKGNFGHGLLITTSKGKAGAGVLAAGAYLRSGAGLLTVAVPGNCNEILQATCPEAMTLPDPNPDHISVLPDLTPFSTIGIGPGLGKHAETAAVIDQLLTIWKGNLVVDADALNILSEQSTDSKTSWWSRLPANTILTPHPGEFKRMVGSWSNDFEKLDLQRGFATKYGVIVILKGKYTTIALPNGTLYFNSTGNPGMAKGGSGDVLTGLLTGILSSGYFPRDTALLGVYLHGLAGDLAADFYSQEGMTAGDIVGQIGYAFKLIK